MANIGATEFKAKCLELMNRVAERRETFVITKRGKPVAKLAPVERKPKESLAGCMRNKVAIVGDIFGPALQREAWNTAEEWDELMKPATTKEISGRIRVRRPPRKRK